MKILRFLATLTIWIWTAVFLLTVTGLAIWFLLIWPDVKSHYPNRRAAAEAADWQAYILTSQLDAPIEDCDAALETLNSLAALGSGHAYSSAHLLSDRGECGPIEGADLSLGLAISQWVIPDLPTSVDQIHDYLRRFSRLAGIGAEGDRRFWQDYYTQESCMPRRRRFDIVNWEHFQAEGSSYRDIRMRQYEFNYQCSEALWALGQRYLDHDDSSIREQAVWMISLAGERNHPEARWWLDYVLPELDAEYYGYFIEEGREYTFPDHPCAAFWTPDVNGSFDRERLREIVGLGQPDAADLWLADGPYQTQRAFWDCIRDQDPDRYHESFAWNGGYDTPFWYAVHALRTGDTRASNQLDSLAARLGEDCFDLAADVADGLRPILPGPPVDDPELRALVVSTINCQPEGLREALAYANKNLWPAAAGQYLPPEARQVLPSFEPIFRREG